ncbi:MAG: hypothetical protein WCI60_00185 [bacterium]
MNESYETTYYGLPVPSDDELFELQSKFMLNENSAFNPFLTANEIIFKNPVISEIIRDDIDYWQQNECVEDLDSEEINEFSIGISSGYAFFIGVSTLIAYIRSNHPDIRQYIEDEENQNILSKISDNEQERIAEVRKGDAIIEILEDNVFVEDSSDLAFVDAGDYSFEAIRFEQLFNDEIDNIEQMLSVQYKSKCDDRVIANIEGFKHGVANAVEMYIQIEEERIIQRLKK